MTVFTGQLLARICPTCRQPIPDDATECIACGRGIPAVEHFPTIPGYKIIQRLGEGGMGTVYLAIELDLGRKVAIKVLSSKFSRASSAMERFEREARVMATVEHEHIVRVYTLSHFDGGSFLVLEYVEGESLADYINRSKKLSIVEATRILRQIIEGLAATWSKNIVHRDIKPSNILLDRNQNVHVTDFGLAKPIEMERLGDSISSDGILLGTPYYVAPEQALGQPVDFRADIYSVGIMLFEMLTGAKPFDGQTPFEIVNQHLTRNLPSIREWRPDVPNRIVSLLNWMTQKKPDRRPKSYAELLDALLPLQQRRAMDTSKAQAISAIVTWHAKKAANAILLPLLLIVVAVLTFVFFHQRPQQIRAPEQAGPNLTIAVAPFYGPDQESAKEGKIMGALIEKTIRERLGEEVQVLGVEQTRDPIRSHQTARALGHQLKTSLVIWGDVVVLRNEVEIEPHVTMVHNKAPAKGIRSLPPAWNTDPFASLTDQNPSSFVLSSESANQIELRKTSAASIGDTISVLIAIHTLYAEQDPEKALALFEQTPATPENLYYRACALIGLQKIPQAIKLLQLCLTLNHDYAPAHALFGDLMLASGNYADAISHYQAAAKSEQAFTASRAFFQGGNLYAKETFHSNTFGAEKELDTSWLIRVDPNSGNVTRRFHLPGIPKAFNAERGTVQIFYDPGFGHQIGVPFEKGELNVPAWGEEDLMLRVQNMQSGWILPTNFLTALQRAEMLGSTKFEPLEIVSEDLPQTLPDLESALASAIARDPTQPWHRFFLGQVLWWQGDRNGAEEQWLSLTANKFPYVCYYEFSWMSSFFEGYGQNEWADFAYNQALQLRKKLPLGAGYATPAERVINANFIRTAAISTRNSGDLERGYLWLTRARELTGISPEADQFAAMLWSKYFLAKGDLQRANLEDTLFRQSQKFPLNITRATTLLDYTIYVSAAASIAFLLVLFLLFAKAARSHVSAEQINSRLTVRDQVVRAIVYALLTVLVMIGAHQIAAGVSMEVALTGICVVILFMALLRSRKVTVRSFVGAFSSANRKVFVFAFVVVVLSLANTVYHNGIVHALLSSPPAPSDIQPHFALLDYMEERLKTSDTANGRFVTAVLNQKSGNFQRAQELYQTIQMHSGASQNLTALQSGSQKLVADISPEELMRALSDVPLRDFALSVWDLGKGINIFSMESQEDIPAQNQIYFTSLLFQLSVLFSVALILLFLYIKPAGGGVSTFTSASIHRAMEKPISLLIPGAFDLQRARPLHGYLMLLLFLLAACGLLAQWMIPSRFPVPGVATFFEATNYLNLHPLPILHGQPDMDAFLHDHFWSIFWAYPYAKAFWGFILISGCAALIFHLARLRHIWRTI